MSRTRVGDCDTYDVTVANSSSSDKLNRRCSSVYSSNTDINNLICSVTRTSSTNSDRCDSSSGRNDGSATCCNQRLISKTCSRTYRNDVSTNRNGRVVRVVSNRCSSSSKCNAADARTFRETIVLVYTQRTCWSLEYTVDKNSSVIG